MMSTLPKILAVLAILLVMAGCGLQQYAKEPSVDGYPYRHADFDYKYAWKTTTTEQGVFIDGIMKNVRYSYIESLFLTIEVLSKDGAVVGRESDFPRPQQTREGDVSQFGLLLRNVRPTAGDSFRFTVHYTGNEGNDQKINWISIFTADALTGAVIRPPGKIPDRW